jgi:ParB family chromosome partitioning protein
MSGPKSSWSFVGISPEARQAAEEAAEAAGMELDSWLTQLIKYTSAMELKGGAPRSLDETIRQATAPTIRVPDSRPSNPPAGAEASAASPAAPQSAFPGVDTMPKPDPTARPPQDAGEVPLGGGGHSQDAPIDTSSMPRLLSVDLLRPHPNGYIAEADEQAVQDAIEVWRKDGDLRPLVARPMPHEPGLYEVIAGVARWHAARRAHIREVPVLVRTLSDDEALREGLVARLRQGGPLAALDEGEIYMLLMTELGLSSEAVARLVNKTPAHIATMVRVLNLPKGVRDMLDRGEITVLHARALLDAPNPEAIARDVVRRRLDIYQTEQLVRIASKATQMVDARAVEAGYAEAGSEDAHVRAADRQGYGGEGQWQDPAAQRNTKSDIRPPRIRTGTDARDYSADYDSADGAGATRGGGRGYDGDFGREPAAAASRERRVPTLPMPPAGGRDDQAPRDAAREDGARNNGDRVTDGRGAGARNDNVATTEWLERHLSNLLGLKVAINEYGNMGVVTLHYSDRDQLSELIARLNSASNG